MNAARRKRINDAIVALEMAQNVLSEVLEEEQGDFDNLTESEQQSQHGEIINENISHLEEAIDNIEHALEDATVVRGEE